jgi:hypothetical protein
VLESVLGNEMHGDTDEERTILKKLWMETKRSVVVGSKQRFARDVLGQHSAHQRRQKMTAAAGRSDGQVLEERPSGGRIVPRQGGILHAGSGPG